MGESINPIVSINSNSNSNNKCIDESNIDYLKELNNLRNGCTFVENNDYDNKCLISADVLEQTCITLKCSHKFNYIPLFNYLLSSCIKSTNGIKCPYCSGETYNTLPIRIINNKIWYNDKINEPLEKCITDEHKCCHDSNCEYISLFSLCIKHNTLIFPIIQEIDKSKLEILNRDLRREMYCLIKKENSVELNSSYIYNNFCNIILNSLNLQLLKKICKTNNIKGYSKLKKKEIIELIKSSSIMN